MPQPETLHGRTLSCRRLRVAMRLRGGKATNVPADDAQTLAAGLYIAQGESKAVRSRRCDVRWAVGSLDNILVARSVTVIHRIFSPATNHIPADDKHTIVMTSSGGVALSTQLNANTARKGCCSPERRA